MWILNVLLYLCFVFAPAQYGQRVAAGEPCYAYRADFGNDAGPQPTCWYDPSNVNAFEAAGEVTPGRTRVREGARR